jgi:Chemotaxis phosphatase CheX
MAAELSPALLAQCLARTLEEAAFVFAEPTDDPPPFEGDVIEARLAYSGAHSAELVLAAPHDLAATLAANLLGEEEGGASVTGDDLDALGELLNMIAGSLVLELFGPEAGCKLGLPRVKRVSPTEYGRELARAHAAATLVEEEGRRIDLSACMTNRTP